MVAIILFVSLLGLIILGFPIAISMLLSSLIAILLSGLDPVIIPSLMSGGISSYTLMAIPFFVFLGNLLNSGGITDRIFDCAHAMVGWIKGGLAQVNILSSLIFAGTSGTATAEAAGLGLVEIRAMKAKGYDLKFSVGVTLASSVLGPIIPPSITFLIYASIASVSPAKLFMAGLFPGLLIGLALMVTVYVMCSRNMVDIPAPGKFSVKRLWTTAKHGFFALCTPIVLIWGISSGTVTATEAGIIGVVYALFVGLIYKELTLKKLYEALKDTLLILGFFVDATSVQLIMVPILVPIANALGIDLLTLGVMITVDVMIGTSTPPVGNCLFIMSSISGLSITEVVKGIKIFYIPLVIGLLLITYIGFFTTWLPGLFA
jgi:TRAP-type C4-dicarboxylate transport system permease large subunit